MTREELLEIKSVDRLVEMLLGIVEVTGTMHILDYQDIDHDKDLADFKEQIKMTRERYQELKLEDTSSYEHQVSSVLDKQCKILS